MKNLNPIKRDVISILSIVLTCFKEGELLMLIILLLKRYTG